MSGGKSPRATTSTVLAVPAWLRAASEFSLSPLLAQLSKRMPPRHRGGGWTVRTMVSVAALAAGTAKYSQVGAGAQTRREKKTRSISGAARLGAAHESSEVH